MNNREFVQQESEIKRVNDKGDEVPDKCDQCGSKVGLFFKGEPIWLCSNKDCGKYFGTLPCTIQEGTTDNSKGYHNDLMDETFYRIEYKGIGIYEALHETMSVDEWRDFKQSDAATWLPVPPNYQPGDKSFFTKKGYNKFMKLTYPYVLRYLDESNVCKFECELNPAYIRYIDEYQVVFNKTKRIKESTLPDGVFLRPANESDLPNIIKWKLESVNPKTRNDPKTIRFIENDAKENLKDTKMIMSYSTVIGVLESCYIDDGEWWYIGEIYLIPEYRGKGIARVILQQEIYSHDKLKLRVSKDNTHAIDLYKSLGFGIYEEDEYAYTMTLVKNETFQEGAWQDIRNGVNPKSKKLFFHISMDSKMNGKTLEPRIPSYLSKKGSKSDKYKEDETTPRVCFSPSIEGCLNAIISTQKNLDIVGKNIFVYVPEKEISEYKIKTNKELIKEKLVFDATTTGEMWILEPVKLKLYGVIVVDQVKNIHEKKTVDGIPHGRFDYKWHWAVTPKYVERTLDRQVTYDEWLKQASKENNKTIKESVTMSNYPSRFASQNDIAHPQPLFAEDYVMESFGSTLAKEWIQKPEVIKEINDGIDQQFTSLFSFGIKPTEADLVENRKKVLAKNIEPHILMSMYAKKSFDAMLKEEQRLEEEKMKKEMNEMVAKIMNRRNKPTQEGYVQEGMFVPGFNNLRMKIAQALGDKFKVTNVFKDMSGKEKFDISKADADILTDIKTSVESTGTGCKVISRCVGFAPKIHFNNISLSQALDKILELFEKPELLLEGAMLSRFRNSYYMESDTDDIDGELDKTLEDIESSVNDTDDDDPDNNEDIDINTFGSDTSDVQNEYSQKDIEILNHLIAGESEAINDYFDGAKDSNNETLRRLYGDIGHEERFHLEQLLYAKSTLTGEKYEPRDPEVKKEYEELLAMGMDEETAASTAIDKQGMVGYDDGDDSDMEKLEQETAMIATMLLHNEILTSFCEYFNTHQIDNAVSVFVEAYIMEEMDNVASAPKQVTKIQDPLTLLVKGLQLSINGLIRMGTAIRDSVVKGKLKNYRKWEWIKKNGITGLFANGIHLYLYSDQSSKYDTDTPARYVDLLYRLTKQIGENCGIRLTDAAKHKTISNPIQFNTISEGLNKLKKVVLTKTKVVVNENNKDMLAREFFGYSSEKLNVAVTHGNSETAVRDSNNIYSRLDVLMLLTKEYSKISMEVLNHLKGFEGDSNSIYYKNRKMFNLALDGMKLIVEKYNQFIKAMASDLNTIIKLDNGLLAMTRMRDSTEQSGGKWEGEDIRTQNGVLSKGAPDKYATDKKLPRTPHKW